MSKLPWDIEGCDFEQDDYNYWHSRPYRLWFEFLRLSPTYELAARYVRTRNISNGVPVNPIERPLLEPDQLAQLPPNFEEVVRTYEAFGEVNHLTFKMWWMNRSRHLFAIPAIKNEPFEVGEWSWRESTSDYRIKQNLRAWNDLCVERNVGYKLIAVPLDGSKDDLLDSLDKMLKLEDFRAIRSREYLYRLSCKKLKIEAMEKNLKLLWEVVCNPDKPQWLSGVDAEISPTKTKEYRKNPNGFIEEHLGHFKTSVSRDVKLAKLRVENAACGIFPSSRPVPIVSNQSIRQCLESRIERTVERKKWVEEMVKRGERWAPPHRALHLRYGNWFEYIKDDPYIVEQMRLMGVSSNR